MYGISSEPTAWMFRYGFLQDLPDSGKIYACRGPSYSGVCVYSSGETATMRTWFICFSSIHAQANMQLGGGGRRESTRCTIPMLQVRQPRWEHDSYSSVSISTKLWLELYTASFLKWREMSVIYREAWVDVRLGLYNLKATLFFAFSVWTWRFYLIVVAYWLLKAI